MKSINFAKNQNYLKVSKLFCLLPLNGYPRNCCNLAHLANNHKCCSEQAVQPIVWCLNELDDDGCLPLSSPSKFGNLSALYLLTSDKTIIDAATCIHAQQDQFRKHFVTILLRGIYKGPTLWNATWKICIFPKTYRTSERTRAKLRRCLVSCPPGRKWAAPSEQTTQHVGEKAA